MRSLPPAPTLDERLTAWRDAGLISSEQMTAILEAERHAVPRPVAPPAAERRLPSVAETLGYIGGILSLVGALLLLSRYWDDMASGVRLSLGVIVSLVLLVAGFLVREDADPALRRLRWTLWLLSSAATAATTGFVMVDAIEVDEARSVALVVAVVVAVMNGLLWAGRIRPVQQALFLGALPVVAGTAVGHLTDGPAIGVVVAITGGAVLVAGVLGATVLPALTDGIGAVALLVGVAMLSDDWTSAGLLGSVVVSLGLLAMASVPGVLRTEVERVVLVVVGAITLLQTLPATLGWFSEQAAILTGAVLAAVGAGLIAAARRRLVSAPVVVLLAGGLALVGGLALTGRQSVALATLSGLAAAVVLLALGSRPGWAVMSVFGSLALLVNVPWAIWWFFPGEDRAPLLTTVSGVVIILVAVVLARMRTRLRHELSGDQGQPGPMSAGGASPASALRA